MHDLYLLLGQVRSPKATLPLPARATLVLIHSSEPVVTLWDIGEYFERADAGDETALDDLAAVEDEVSRRTADTIARVAEERRRAG